MSKVEKIISLFGGMPEMSRKLGHNNKTTIQHWKKTGRIPPWRVLEIKLAAEMHGVDIPESLFDENAPKEVA